MLVPQYDDLMNPTIQSLKKLGGQAYIRDIEREVSNILNLSEEEINDVHRGTMTKLVYRLAWSRNYLKRFGLLENVSRGVWALTDEGHKITSVDKEEVKSKVKAMDIQYEQEIENDIQDSLFSDIADVEFENATIEIIKPFDPKRIDITSKTMILDAVFKRLARNEINLLTDFQRQGDLWDPTKQSRLIESVLIRFPLPAFYFDGTDDNKWLVVDGLQRISSFKNFVIDKKLRLQNLEFLTQFENCGFDDLPRDLQRRIEESEITVYIINPGTPDEVKYNIFKRINTGGLVLEPQEIRHALNQGLPAKFVAELANIPEFKFATDYRIATDRMLDREFATRFISFYLNDYSEYRPDLDSFMNKSMADLKKLNSEELQKVKKDFTESMKTAKSIFSQWTFRKVFYKSDRRKPINKALFEVWSVILARLTDNERQELINRKSSVFNSFIELMNNDEKFNDAITSSTGDKTRVTTRFTKVEKLIKDNLN